MSTVIDKQFCENLREQLADALAGLSEQLGVQFSVGRITYDRNGRFAHLKLDVATVSDGGIVETPERAAFKRNAHLYGLQSEWLDAVVTFDDGSRFRIVGLNGKAKKYPVQLVGVKSKRQVKAPVSTIVAAAARGALELRNS